MRINPTDVAQNTTLSPRTASVAPPTSLSPSASANVRVALSSEVRAVVLALTQSLTDTDGLLPYDLLTHNDRLLLASVLEFASAQGLDLTEVRNLALDLARHRHQRGQALSQPLAAPSARALATAQTTSALPTEGFVARAALFPTMLALPRFSPEDEQLARAMLSGLATREPPLDRAFVRALLDPDLQPTHAVSFPFLQRLLGELGPTVANTPPQATLQFPLRDARGQLALAVAALALPRAALADAAVANYPRGEQLLRARVGALSAAASAPSARASWSWLTQLTRNDRQLLSLLYSSADTRVVELGAVDELVVSLVQFRAAERATAREPIALAASSARPVIRPPASSPPAPSPPAPSPPASSPPASSPLVSSDARARPPAGELAPLPQLDSAPDPRPAHAEQAWARPAVLSPEAERSEPGSNHPQRLHEELASEPTSDTPAGAREPPREPREARADARPGDQLTHGQVPPHEDAQPVLPAAERRAADLLEPLPNERSGAPHGALAHEPSRPHGAAEEPAFLGSSRSYGSTTQVAALLSASYGRVGPSRVPPAAPQLALPGVGGDALRAAVTRDPGALAIAPPARPLDVAHALGLGPLLLELRGQSLRSRRKLTRKKRRNALPGIGPLRAIEREGESEQALVEDPSPSSRGRWQRLLRERMRRRRRAR